MSVARSRRDTRWRTVRRSSLRLAGRFVGYRVAQRLTRDVPRILMFHRFSRHPAWRTTELAVLQATLQVVQREYHAVSLDHAVGVMSAGGNVGPRSVVLTVDDAYEDFYRLALPLFERYRLPVALYVPTDFVDGRSWLWPDKLLWMIRETKRSEVVTADAVHLPLSTLRQRRRAWNALADELLELDDAARTRVMHEIEEQLDVRAPDLPTEDYRPMTWQQVRDAVRRGVCVATQAGAHIPLARESEAIQRQEALRSKQRLEAEIGAPVRHFSYPHGRACDFDHVTMRAAMDAGYVSAAAAVPDVGRPITPFCLPRISVPEYSDDLPGSLSGISNFLIWARA